MAVSTAGLADRGRRRWRPLTRRHPGVTRLFEVDPRPLPRCYRTERADLRHGAVDLVPSQGRRAREHVPATGPVILAPVHRSFADFGFAAFCTDRKLFFMTKDEMWKNKWLGRLLLTVGAFPVHRGVGRPRGAPARRGGAAQGTGARAVPRGHPTRRAGDRGPHGGGGVPVRPHRRAHRAHRHRRLGPGHAQGECRPQAAHHPGGDRPRHSAATAHRGRTRARARPCTPRPRRSCPKLQAVYDEARARTGRY